MSSLHGQTATEPSLFQYVLDILLTVIMSNLSVNLIALSRLLYFRVAFLQDFNVFPETVLN